MYVVGLDQSWLQTPFLFHRRLIKSQEEIDQLMRRGIREVVIDSSRGADVDASQPVDDAALDIGAGDFAERSGAPASQVKALSPAESAFRACAAELPAAQVIHEQALAAAQSIFDGAGIAAPVRAQVAERVVADLSATVRRSPEANLLLMQMGRFKRDMSVHAVNVCVLSLVVNAVEEFTDDTIALGMGALLHDLGETRLPKNLLYRAQNLTPSERRLLEQHPALGAKLLEDCQNIPPAARRVVLEHHERIDGTGYPNRTVGADLLPLTRIVAITDLYDDMLCGRRGPAMQPIDVLRQLFTLGHAGALDRDLVERVIRSLGVYPVGSLVELNTGERGIVVAANRADTLKPTLRLIPSRLGAEPLYGPIINLAECRGEERRVVGALNPVKEGIDPLAFLKWAPESRPWT